jgi:multiple sugar transport system substrate-binding protein
VSPRRNSIASLENGAQISDIIGAEVQAAVLGMKSPQQASDDMQSKLEAAM